MRTASGIDSAPATGRKRYDGSPLDFWKMHGWRHPFLFLHAIYYYANPPRYVGKIVKVFNFINKNLPRPLWRIPFIRALLVYLPNRYHGKVLTLENAQTIVKLDADIKVDPKRAKRVLTYELVNQIVIESAGAIALGDCICRSLIDNPCKPNHVCMFIGEPFATYAVKRGKKLNINYATKQEALEALRQAHEAGYVHNAFFKDAAGDRLFAVCNCCSCCCKGIEITNIFKDVYHDRMPVPRMLESSGYLATRDMDKCVGCGVCVKACHFKAVSLVPENGAVKARLDHAKCLGCGQCVDRCQAGAVTLKQDPYGPLPLDLDDLTREQIL